MQNADNLRLCHPELMHSFSKPNSFIHGVCSVLSLNAVFAFQKSLLWSAETKGQICILEVIYAVSRPCFQMCAVKNPILQGLRLFEF